MAATSAADGRDALMTAPGASSLTPGPLPSLPLPGPDADAGAIADALAVIAGELANQLTDAAHAAPDPRDQEALRAASRSASAVRECLTGTG